MPDEPLIPPRLPSDPVPDLNPAASPLSLPFGAQLEPILKRACGERLSAVRWFRTDWQRGGALTGYATYRDDRDQDQPVVVKLPVKPSERQWLVRLGPMGDVAPRVYAHGDYLAGYDMAWVVMECLPHGPLSPAWDGKEFDLIVEAASRFYTATSRFPVDVQPPDDDWSRLLDRSRKHVREHRPAGEKRWAKALKRSQRKIKEWVSIWADRPTDQWCHGDLHLANAMTRAPAPGGPAVLLDFALTHAGHWVEDAVYLEHQYWAWREKLDGRKLCQMIARQRRSQGLPVSRDWARWASARRALLALRAPVVRRISDDPKQLSACLEVLELELESR